MINFFIKNFEIIRNIIFFLTPTLVAIVFIFLVYYNNKKIKVKNERIEKIQNELDQDEINSIKGTWHLSLDDTDGSRTKKKRRLEQEIQKLERERKYLLEEISIFKIFKK
ncbi:MAG: hypothetical protein AAB350_01210 [Patescibacteria group bacterium]